MIQYVVGNIFESNADCLINTVNCEGYMGKGIAYQFKMRYPANNIEYVKACKSGKLYIGTIFSFNEENTWIVNIPTKNKWREKSNIDYIVKGLDCLVEFLQDKKPKCVAIPPLGCGNGGLDWSVVKKIINDKLMLYENDYDFLIYEPFKSYEVKPLTPPKMSVSSLLLLKIRMNLAKFNNLRLQKTCFFMNYFLDEEYFDFKKHKYGPYSHSIDIVAKKINEYQKYYNLNNSEDTYKHIYNLICSKNTEDKIIRMLPAIKKATEYVNKISTDKKLECVSTILYIIEKEKNIREDQIVYIFKNWSEDKKKRFRSDYIKNCIDYLENTNIISKDICGNYEFAKNIWR